MDVASRAVRELSSAHVRHRLSDDGQRGAALHPLHGREAVARFVLASTRFVSGDYRVEIADVNVEPAVILRLEEQARVVLFVTVARGQLQEIRAIGNPDKLKHV